MPLRISHDWNLTPSAAVELQRRLRDQVRLAPLASEEVRTIAGADISYNRFSDVLYAGIVVLDRATLQIVETAELRGRATFPYVPGLLSFREMPILLEVWERLRTKPDVLMFDGHGLAHPRRFGIACHAGVLLDLPTIGCGKTILVGAHGELGPEAGCTSPLLDRGEEIGVALRTKRRVTPVYVSAGHRIDLPSAVALTLGAVSKYRQPEPTRQAHLLVNRIRMADKAAP